VVIDATVQEKNITLSAQDAMRRLLKKRRCGFSLTVKEAIFALAPTLERMKKRGFDSLAVWAPAIQEIAEKPAPWKQEAIPRQRPKAGYAA
jgi:hypothetical protein